MTSGAPRLTTATQSYDWAASGAPRMTIAQTARARDLGSSQVLSLRSGQPAAPSTSASSATVDLAIYAEIDDRLTEFWNLAPGGTPIVFRSPGTGGNCPDKAFLERDGTVSSNKQLENIASYDFHRGTPSDDRSNWAGAGSWNAIAKKFFRDWPRCNLDQCTTAPSEWMEGISESFYALKHRGSTLGV